MKFGGVELVDLISLGPVRAKPYTGNSRVEHILQYSTASTASEATAGMCNSTLQCNAM